MLQNPKINRMEEINLVTPTLHSHMITICAEVPANHRATSTSMREL